jgi:glycosyltransferase involved in cell wall biosynthesis
VKDEKKVLIFIPAYHVESTLEKVLNRIPAAIYNYNYEILIIDDKSSDHTFDRATAYKSRHKEIHLTLLCNPENQGYGGNQKLGYRYAIENDFDAVVLLHGDGQYPPEVLEKLILPVLDEKFDAVFGTRMAKGLKPVSSGMPLYKYAGNRILSSMQNRILGMRLSEFHSGYRVYAVKTLKQIPFELNTNGFHFNTEMVIQLKLNESRISEIPIPTCYNDEKCYVNGFVYAWNVIKAALKAKFQQMNISYHRQFDISKPGHGYPPKFDFLSSHTMAINEVTPGAHVLDIGCGAGHIGRELEKRRCQVTGVDIATEEEENSLQKFSKIDLNREAIPFPPDSFDFILILDVLEHLDPPAQFNLLEKIRAGSKSKKPVILITVPNIAFLFIRWQLLMGKFNYGKQGILDMTHRYLFTFKSIRRFLKQAGYKIEKTKGIPPPYPLVIGNNVVSRFLLRINAWLIWLIPGLFSYQIFVKATPLSTAKQLLKLAAEQSRERELNIKQVTDAGQ